MIIKYHTIKNMKKTISIMLALMLTVILCVTHCEYTIFNGSVFTGKELNKVYTTDSILDIYKVLDFEGEYYEMCKDKLNFVKAGETLDSAMEYSYSIVK